MKEQYKEKLIVVTIKGMMQMGKFDGILICTDIDDTLLTSDKRVSEENKKAIKYFESEGGLFTFATGRAPIGVLPVINDVMPNAPMICFNGCGFYDFAKEEYTAVMQLDEGAADVVEFVDKTLPYAGIEVFTDSHIYICRANKHTEAHQKFENFNALYSDYRNIKEDWVKTIFMVDEEKMPELRAMLENSAFADRFTFVKSSPWYFELLPKGAGKGNALLTLADMLRIDRKMTIGIGDDENDESLLRLAGIGIAVANGAQRAINSADYITVDNNSHAISAVIYSIVNGNIKI